MRDNHRARLVLTLLLLAAVTLITLDYRSGALGGARGGGSTVFGPVEDVVSDVVHPIGSWFSAIGHLGSYKRDNASLTKRVSQLQEQLRLSASDKAQLTELQAVDHLAGQARFRIVAARVTAVGGSLGFEWTATIDRGSDNGISANETVINGDGLVGRIKRVGRTTSTVVLANDPESTAGARLAGSQQAGEVTGGGRGPMTLTLLSTTARIADGDRLVTLGSQGGRPYVPEVPIGHVVSVSPPTGSVGRTATVDPYVDYTAVDVVAVVVGSPPSIKQDSLLPPAPQGTPRPTVTVTVTATPKSRSGASSSP